MKVGKVRSYLLLPILVAVALSLGGVAQATDSLYIGDGARHAGTNDTIKQFDATTGAYQGLFVKSSGGLKGPMGMVFNSAGDLIVNAQFDFTSTNGVVLEYGSDGTFLEAIVPHDSPVAPSTPRGLVLTNGLFVANMIANSNTNNHKGFQPGWLMNYATDGSLLSMTAPPPDALPAGAEFHPRGIVKGPDGLLYVSNYPNLSTGLGGQVLRFNPANGAFVDVFITSSGGTACSCTNELNRPEGLVFSPNGTKIYITSFRDNALGAVDYDKIIVFDAATGAWVDHIQLDPAAVTGTVPSRRAFAQALLFGPGGKLFVPITGNGPDTGAVRSYNVSTKTYTNFVPPAAQGGPIGSGWYLTFGQTNPATLGYGN